MDNNLDQDKIKERLDKLERDIEDLKGKRIYQTDITPDAIKQRHLGEANRYIWAGLEANLPTGVSVTSSVTAFFATDTHKLYIWDGTAYKSTTLT